MIPNHAAMSAHTTVTMTAPVHPIAGASVQ